MEPEKLFTEAALQQLFPPERADDFFDALFGDASEGAYDITLTYVGYNRGENVLDFSLDLHQRPGRCLACNLTYGLPEVFSRHPIINMKGLVAAIEQKMGGEMLCVDWRFGRTQQKSSALHCIPLQIQLKMA